MRDYRGYLRRVSALYTLYGMLPTTWQLSILAVLSAVGTSLGLYNGNLFRAFIGLMVAFGLGSMGLFFTQLLVRNATVYTKLGIGGMGIASVGADIKANVVKEFSAITINVSVQNTGVRDIFFKFLRTDLSVLNIVNQDAKLAEDIHLIPVGFPQSFNLATIQHIKVPTTRSGGPTPVVGKMKLEFAYGPRRGNWSYVLFYEADLAFTWNVNPPGRGGHQTAQVFISNSITKNSHESYYARS
jgi:hypothetical protein